MVGSGHSSSSRRLVASVVALAIATAGLVAIAEPAGAVHAAPWRFTTVTEDSQISGNSGAEPLKGWVLQCPAGYTAVSGGIVGGDETVGVRRLLEYPNPADGTYHILAYNYGGNGTTIRLAANCVWLDDVGSITTVTQEFARNGSGLAGGTLRCPEGTTVLSGGVDWSNTSRGRRIDYSTPITDGTTQGTGWYVAGYSDVSGVLGIELRCVSSSLLGSEYAEADDTRASSPGVGTAQAVCTTGYRLLTGGAAPAGTKNPGAYQGFSSVSGPLDARHWPVQGYQYGGAVLRALALCVPASTVSGSFTQRPPTLTTANSGSVTFTAADSAGENLTFACTLDAHQRACTAGSPVAFSGLADGVHSFVVTARNQSGAAYSFSVVWIVDTTAPVLSAHTPTGTASLTGPFGLTFSEAVQGVPASSVVVHAERANVDVAGTVAQQSTKTATWTPNAPLVPGETYRVSLDAAILDTAGNAAIPTFFTVRATTKVENTSVALQRSWDVDTKAIASGGAYIVSNLSGSQADLTFNATGGQTAVVDGIRMPDGGNADVYLDGVKKETVSFYAATAARVRVYRSAALTAGTHTISIRPLGTKPAASTNSWVAVDDVAVGFTVRQESSLVQSFRRVASASAYGGSYDTMTQAPAGDTTPARVQFNLVGTGFKVFATKTAASGQARVYVDGALKATINLSSAATTYKALVYSTTFALGPHVVRIEAVGTTTGANSSVNLDRITIS
jgi:Bacterial Ig-like domain